MRKVLAITLGVALALTATVALAARDSGGTYSRPSGNPVTTGTPITSSWANALTADIATEITDSLSRSGKGPMLAPLKLYSGGNATTPELVWNDDTNSGFYLIANDDIGLSLGGTKRVDFASTGVAFTDPVSFLGSTTTTGIASHTATARFLADATFAASVTVPTPGAATDAANKGYVDADLVWTTMASYGTNWTGAPIECAVSRGLVYWRGTASSSGGCNITIPFTVPVVCRPAVQREGVALKSNGGVGTPIGFKIPTSGAAQPYTDFTCGDTVRMDGFVYSK